MIVLGKGFKNVDGKKADIKKIKTIPQRVDKGRMYMYDLVVDTKTGLILKDKIFGNNPYKSRAIIAKGILYIS